jgi:Cu/Ag efflux pump CusA
MNGELEKYPGIVFDFSQNIEHNVEEPMSGVKGENSLKLFGDDILGAAAARPSGCRCDDHGAPWRFFF